MSHPNTGLSAAKLALAVKRRLDEEHGAPLTQSDPIAIVGIGCRLPGNVHTPDDYWRLLLAGVDTIREVPAARWSADAWYDPDPQAIGKTNGRFGSFLDGVDEFDPAFFGLAPREAPFMDPQQRILLEVTWEALWDAGLAPHQLAGSRTGVFMALCTTDYSRLLLGDGYGIGGNSLAGASLSIASGRISYLLDLRGPSVSIDTACSSSLVTVHMACQSLRAGESRVALAGGASLHLTHEHYVALAKLGMLSPDGRCKTFDASADGFVPGEGSGVVVLKRLADALIDGDRVHAVIRGTALTQDGHTTVMTAPSGLAQQAAVRAALENGRVGPEQIGYVETHGTGTALGDPIEVEAIAEVLGGTTPCALGAVKTNLGHLEAAAGIAGLIKAALSLEHEAIPANLHFRELNTHISLEGTQFFLPTATHAWPRSKIGRFAGVSSFGFGGTNAHVVLEEAPAVPSVSGETTAKATAESRSYLLPISARSPDALTAFARRYQELLATTDSIANVARAAAVRRSHYEERLAVTGATAAALRDALQDVIDGRPRSGASRGSAVEDQGVVFVCSGQGSQWARMGASLLTQYPVFRAAIDECDVVIRAQGGWSLREQLEADESTSRLHHTEYAQPAIVTLEIALAKLWASWGVVPTAVVGHSVGEISAAHIAGAIDLEEAMRIVLHRGRLMERATGHGRMALVALSPADVQQEIARFGDTLSLAAINSPHSVVVSGETAPMETLSAEWNGRGISCRPLPVDYAFHSAQMEPFREELTRILGRVTTHATAIPMISTVTGNAIDSAALNAEYWGNNIRRPVLLSDALQRVIQSGARTFVEIGPHAVLSLSMQECLAAAGTEGDVLPSMRRNQDERTTMFSALATLYTRGAPVEWTAVYPGQVPVVSLPTYPYQRQRYWIQRSAAASALAQPASSSMPSVDAITNDATAKFRYRIAWHARLRSDPVRSVRTGQWLVIGDPAGVSGTLARALESRGESCTIVSRDMLSSVAQTSQYRGVVHLDSLEDAPSDDAHSSDTLEDVDLTRACRTALALVHKLVQQSGAFPRVWFVTRGAHAVTPDDTCPGFGQAGLHGLARTIAAEHPDSACTTVDLDPASDITSDIMSLVDEILLADAEDCIALRHGGRYVARLTHELSSVLGAPSLHSGNADTHGTDGLVPPNELIANNVVIHPQATYLVTGGLGGIGLRVARWLVERGATHVMLIGRSSPSPEAQDAIAAMKGSGATVMTAAVDISDRAAVGALLQTLRQSMPPLRGIVHAAGVLDDGVLMQQGWERFRRVLAPKVYGAWHLHELTQQTPLDFFVMCSSVSALFSSPGQGAYAAANAMLDALAEYRHAQGYAGLSINWGVWSDVGMAARLETAGKRRVLGAIRPMSPDDCVRCLERAMASSSAHTVVADVNWAAWAGHVPSLLTDLVRGTTEIVATAATTVTQPREPRTDIVQQLAIAPATKKRGVLVGFIHQEARRVLGLEEGHPIDERQPLLKLGLDSLMAVELRNRVAAALGQPLPATILFDHPTSAAFADFILGGSAQVAPVAPAADTVLQDIAAMSDEDAELLLARELGTAH